MVPVLRLARRGGAGPDARACEPARVTFFADLVEVRYDPARLGLPALQRRIEELGYQVRREGERPDRGPLLRFGLAAFLQMNVMWLSYALYAHGDDQALERRGGGAAVGAGGALGAGHLRGRLAHAGAGLAGRAGRRRW